MKRLFYTLSLAIGLLALPCLLFSQRTITGTVTDAESGLTLIGANVIVMDAEGVGTSTDIDGSYSLVVPEGSTTIQFSYTGFATQEVVLGASNVIDVIMQVGSLLNEVVVIGYGEVKREDATGSVTAVGEESFNKGAITSPQELLAGKVAGVQITTDGSPGSGAQIRIRGGSSLSASNDPLIVIDGVPLFNEGGSGTRNIFNFVNPNDIETFTVLKDASATAIYGSRASNGVILITTKKGSSGKINVTYNGNISYSEIRQTVDLLNADEYRNTVNGLYPAADHPTKELLGDANTDWQDEVYRSAGGHDHNLSFTGGVKNLPYRASVGYSKMNGILKNDEFQRTTASLNLTPKFLDSYLQVNASVRGMREENKFGNRGAIFSSLFYDPTQPVFDDESPFGYHTWLDYITNADGDTTSVIQNPLAPSNPVALLEQAKDEATVNRIVASTTLDYRFHFLPELRANLNMAYDRAKAEGSTFADSTAAFAFDATNGGGYDNTYSQETRNELLEFYLNYIKEIGGSKFDLMAGYSWQHYYQEDEFFNTNLRRTPSETRFDTTAQEYYLVSLFGRFNYTLLDRYLFTFTLRQDESSRFAKDFRKGIFPAAAFAWKIIDNDGKGDVSNLKLRLGYGVTGQQSVGPFYPAIPAYRISEPNASYILGTDTLLTLRPDGYNAALQWEETETYNAAVDFGFMNERITGSVEYYFRKTKDLLNNITTAAGSNFTDRLVSNIGNLENQGVELSLNVAAIEKDDFTWDIGFNATRNRNEITKLTAVVDTSYIGVQVGGIAGGVGNNIQIHSVGFPAFAYYVSEQVYDEAGNPIEGLYVDRNGDGIYNEEDMYRLQQPAPDYFFGITSNLTYKNFDFSFAARANVGNYNYNNIEAVLATSQGIFRDNYTQNVHSAYSRIGFNGAQYTSDYFIQNGSFLRVDHVTVGYDFASFIDNVSWLKLYATVQNPIIITKYDGLDPELAGGIDANIYPRSRRFLIGLNARF